MPAYKDAQKGTWYAAFYYQDWKGIRIIFDKVPIS